MLELEVITAASAASVALDPIKSRLLFELASPASAASLAERVGLTRQKVNYHLRVLEKHKLVVAAEERRWGGLTERLLVASARTYVVSPAALGPVAADPARSRDRLSAGYLIALAARIVRELGELWAAALQSEKRLATLSIDTVIHFRSAADRTAFSQDLTRAVAQLAARYHDESAPGSRPHRLVIGAYPAPAPTPTPADPQTSPTQAYAS